MRRVFSKVLMLGLVSVFLMGVFAACFKLDSGEFILDEIATVKVGKTVRLTLVNTTTHQNVTWESDDESIAKVSRTGTVTGVKEGTVYISASAGDFYDECEVTVTSDDPVVDPSEQIPSNGAVSTAAQLRSIGSKSSMLNRNYHLTADIDFENGDLETIGTWDGASYSGTFDGKGFAIMNVRFTGGASNKNTNVDNATFGNALFSILTGTVKNLNLINAKSSGDGFCAAIAAKNSGTVENCYVGGAQTKVNASKGWEWWVPAGGLVAINEPSGVVKNCIYNAPVVDGGFALIGWNFGTATNCYAAKDRYPVDASDDELIITEGTKITDDGGLAGPSACAFLTDAQLKVPASYAGFSSDAWEMVSGKMAYLKGAGERTWATI